MIDDECPSCGSGDVSYDYLEDDYEWDLHCLACDCSWNDEED